MTYRGVTPLEAAQADFVVCGTISSLPPISALPKHVQREAADLRARSTRQLCNGCGAKILVGPEVPPLVPRVCPDCHKSIKDVAARAFGKAN